MLKRFEFIIASLGVAIAAIALYVSLIERRSSLEVQFLGTESVLGLKDGNLSDVTIFLGHQQVHTLSRQNFLIRNSGSKPITGSDIVSPIELTYLSSSRLLFTKVSGTEPPGFPITISLPTNGANSVEISFPLLNPGDTAYFSIYSYDSTPNVPVITGRVQGVKVIELSALPNSPALSWWQRWLPGSLKIALNCLSSLLMAAFIFFLVSRTIKLTTDFRARREWDKRYKQQVANLAIKVGEQPEPPENEWLRTPWTLNWVVSFTNQIGYTKRHLLEKEVTNAGIPPRPDADVTEAAPLTIQVITFAITILISLYIVVSVWLVPRL